MLDSPLKREYEKKHLLENCGVLNFIGDYNFKHLLENNIQIGIFH